MTEKQIELQLVVLREKYRNTVDPLKRRVIESQGKALKIALEMKRTVKDVKEVFEIND